MLVEFIFFALIGLWQLKFKMVEEKKIVVREKPKPDVPPPKHKTTNTNIDLDEIKKKKEDNRGYVHPSVDATLAMDSAKYARQGPFYTGYK